MHWSDVFGNDTTARGIIGMARYHNVTVARYLEGAYAEMERDCPDDYAYDNAPDFDLLAAQIEQEEEDRLTIIARGIYALVYTDLDDYPNIDKYEHKPRVIPLIRDWLFDGDGGENRAVKDLAQEWRDVNRGDPDYMY
jgi:hypothetical protein